MYGTPDGACRGASPIVEYYRCNLRKISYKECWSLTHNWHMIILGLAKILRFHLPAPEGLPYPHSLGDQLTEEQA